MQILLDKIKKNIDIIKSANDGKPSFFAISSTTKIARGYNAYCTPNRFFNCFNSAGCIVFTKAQAEEIALLADGLTDYMLIDSGKSVVIDNNDRETRLPLAEIIVPLIKKSKLCYFKPNDITAEAIWHFAVNISGNLINRKVAVIGAGNIGSKAALKFLESGCNVSIFRRNSEAAELIAKSFQMLNSLNCGTIRAAKTVKEACFEADIIIGATPGVPAIDIECLKTASAHPLCIDTGKDSFFPDAMEYAASSGIEIFRTDITATLEGVISSILREELISKLHRGKKLIEGVTIVSGGVLGRAGDIVVDSLLNPQHIYGVADGCGDLKHSIDEEDKKRLHTLMKHIESRK